MTPSSGDSAVLGSSMRGYEVLERLGRHGGLTVYRAYQASAGREVALTFLPAHRLATERPQLADLEHPHILSVFDYWRDDDGAYLATPLLRGGTLERSLASGLWRPAATLRLLDQIGAALSHAHHRGIVHGHIRPSNVLLDDDGNAYLTGFILGEPSRQPADNAGAVAPYVTPEALSGHDVGPATDIYCLAVLTCEMLTGAAPEDAPFAGVDLPRGFDQIIERATDPDPNRRYEQVGAFVAALRQAFGVDGFVPGSSSAAAARNPFKGLAAFGEADALDFFGRDELVADLVERVAGNPLVGVVGPSGSGKSSLVRAGLIPAIRRSSIERGRNLVIAEVAPRSAPFAQLRTALERVAPALPANVLADLGADEHGLLRVCEQLRGDETDLVLIIDQLEELFRLTSDEGVRRLFLSNLAVAAGAQHRSVRIVVALRSDVVEEVSHHVAFMELMQQALVEVTVPPEAGLTEAIVEPARRVGLEIEPGLAPTMLRDLVGEPAALPVMQHTLTELAEASRGGRVTLAEYDRLGGVIGTMVTRAEDLFTQLSPAGRAATQELFLRLVAVDDEGTLCARRIRRTDLSGLAAEGHALDTVIDAFGSARLLSFDRDPTSGAATVELGHGALVRAWPRARQWIDARHEDLAMAQRLETSVSEWHAGDRNPSYLISGAQLEAYERWAAVASVPLTADQRSFLEQSRRLVSDDATARARRRRLVVASVCTLMAMALTAATVAIIQRNRADDEARDAVTQAVLADESAQTAASLRDEAQRRASIEEARALVARAASADDPDLRLLLALEAHALVSGVGTEDPSVTSALYQFTHDHRVDLRLPIASETVTVDASPDGTLFVATSVLEPRASIVDRETGAVRATLELPADAFGSAWLTDDWLVATGRTDGTIEIWGSDGQRVRTIDAAQFPVRPLFAANGQLVYAQFSSGQPGLGRIVALEGIGGEVVFSTPQTVIEAVGSPTGSHLLVVEVGSVLRVYRTDTWDDVTTGALSAALTGSEIRGAGWDASTDRIWVVGDRRVRLLDVRTGEEIVGFDTGMRRPSFVVPSTDGALLAVGSASEPTRVFDARSGTEVALIDGSVGVVTAQRNLFRRGLSVSWTPDQQLVVSQPDGIAVWDFGDLNAAAAVWPPGDFAPTVAHLTPSGHIVLGSDAGKVTVFDADGRRRGSFVAAAEPAVPAMVSDDGSTLASSAGGAVAIRDLADVDTLRAVGPEGFPRPLALSADGQLLVAGTSRVPADRQHTVAIVDTETGELLRRLGTRLDGERGAFTSDSSVAVLPIARVVNETALLNSGLWLIDVATGEPIGKGPPQNCITAVALSSDDALAATVGCDGDVSLFAMELLAGPEPWTARLAGSTEDRTAGVGVTFGPDNDVVIVTRADGRIQAFEADERFASRWSFDIGPHAGAPVVRDRQVWVGAIRGFGAGSSGGAIAVPLDLDELASFATETVTRELSDEECQQYLGRGTC